jgi:2-keto-3-deoxy-L-rhamnonate aldolase RhmA
LATPAITKKGIYMTSLYRVNHTKAALLRGETVAVPEINRVFNPIVVELIAQAGYTCVWIDMEHSHLDLDALSNMILAARTVDLDVIVRIPHGPYNQIIKPLELGAGGLIWPHCKTADEARQFVRMAKFRPLGLRGMGAGRDSLFGKIERKAFLEQANEQTLLGVMIEDEEGVADADAIAAVEGIDLLFVGPGDLAHSYGVEREAGHPITHERVLEAFDKVGESCRAHGKAMGTAVNPGEPMHNVVEKGTRWLNCCHDVTALIDGYSHALQATKGVIGESKK